MYRFSVALAKFGVSEVVIANLLNVTARLDALFFVIRTRKLKTLGKWPGVPFIWLDGICVLASLNPTRELDEGIFDKHCSNVLFFQGSLNETIFLNSSIYYGKECDSLNSNFQSLHVSCLLRFKDLFLGKGKEIQVTNVVK